MAETSWPTVAGSRAVTDDQFELMSTHWSADGVDPNFTATPVFGDSSGRQVKVRGGFDAIVGGHGYNSGSTDVVRSVAANASGSTRYDAVVLGLDRTTWAVTSYVKSGTPGAGTPPALTRNARGSSAGVWEIPLAMVQVVNGASTISAADVTNIAWYVQGETVVTTSTNPLQPPAADYTRMRHSDTGYEFDSIAGAWRRTPWQVARGIIGGKRYNSNSLIVAGIFTAESGMNMDSGAVSLEANRRYNLITRTRLRATAQLTYFIFRLRETNTSGTIVGYAEHTIPASGAYHSYEFVNEITTTSAMTRTYVPTLQKLSGGNIDVATGASFLAAGVWVEDVGPAVPNVVTVVP